MIGEMGREKVILTMISTCFILVIIVPFFSIFSRITIPIIFTTISSNQFRSAFGNSIVSSLLSGSIALLVGMLAAFCVERVEIKFAKIFKVLFVLPMLVPSISHAFGLIVLLGKNGIFTKGLEWNIYGFQGIVIGSVVYAFPISFLILSHILSLEDGLSHESARVLGISSWRRFIGLTLPYLRGSIFSTFCILVVLVGTDYGIPLMIGGHTVTLPVILYNKVAGLLDYGSGAVVGVFLLIPSVIAFIVSYNSTKKFVCKNFVTIPVEAEKGPVAKAIAYTVCSVLSCCILAMILGFVMILFDREEASVRSFFDICFRILHTDGVSRYLNNSILYALLTASIGSALAFFCAYMTSRCDDLPAGIMSVSNKCFRYECDEECNKEFLNFSVYNLCSMVSHLLCLIPMAFPGIVLGLAYVICFHKTSLYGTYAIIVLVNIVHFFSTPYMMAREALSRVNPYLEDIGSTLGVHRFFIVMDVIIPKVWRVIFNMFQYFFVNAMITISAVAFLAPPAPKPMALMLGQYEAQRLMQNAAFVSLAILAINIVFYLLCSSVWNGQNKRKYYEK